MKIGLVIYGSLDILTGGFLYDRRIVEHLRENGHTVEVFALPWRTYPRHLVDNLFSGLLRSLTHVSVDVLMQDELNHPSLFWLNRRLKARVRYPIVSIVHHLRCSEFRPEWQNRLYRWVEAGYLATADGFIFNSHTTRSAVQTLVGNDQPWVVAYPGSDRIPAGLTDEDVTARARERGPLRVLFVGSLIPRKNLHTLLTALAFLPRQGWTLDVVGCLDSDVAYTGVIKQLIAQHALEGQVRLLESLTGLDLIERYSRSHLLAVPSTYEGFGIVYGEGMAFGLPAVGSTTGAAHEVIDDGKDGFLVDPHDPKAMAESIGRLVSDRDLLVRMSLAARARHGSRPTWCESAESVLRFLETLVR